MSVQFVGDGTNTSSVSFTTITLTNNPVISTDTIPIEQNIEVIKSDAGVRTVYQRGERQLLSQMKFALLTNTDNETLREWIEIVSGGKNWFTLQDQNIYTSTTITVDGGSTTNILATPELSAWPIAPIGQWVIMLTGTLAGKRRRINAYSGASGQVIVSPGFSSSVTAGDTFLIGLPVFLTNNPLLRRIPPAWWEVEFIFEELGYLN